MNAAHEGYVRWYARRRKNILCKRDKQLTTLLLRSMDDGLLSSALVGEHLHQFKTLLETYDRERKGLRWVAQFLRECERWKPILDSQQELPTDSVVDLFVTSRITIEQAIDLLQPKVTGLK